MTLWAMRVTTFDQIEQVRVIRNTTRAGYAHFTGEITPEAQILFWTHELPMAWLYADEQDAVVGFGMLRKDDEGRWCTVVGVLPEHAGHDYGKQITRNLLSRCPGRCWGTARRDNPAAVKLHVPEDWEVIDGPDPRLAYFRSWTENAKWPPEGAEEAWEQTGWVMT